MKTHTTTEGSLHICDLYIKGRMILFMS